VADLAVLPLRFWTLVGVPPSNLPAGVDKRIFLWSDLLVEIMSL
jgi:hypothetical protein